MRHCLALFLLLVAMPVNAQWLRAETQHFRIYATISEARIRKEAATLEDFHNLLELLSRQKFSDDAPKLDIYLVNDTAQMQIVAPWSSDFIGGFYSTLPSGIFVVSREPKASDGKWFSARHVMQHEYTHHFAMQAGNTALPSWYVEGFAEYMMTAVFTPDHVDFGDVSPSRLVALRGQKWLSIEQILRRPRNTDLDRFYAQSWLLTHYLNRVDGMPARRDAYLAKVASGADPVDAFKTEIDPDLVGFQSKLETYSRGGNMQFSRMRRTPPAMPAMRVEQLPPAADAMLLPMLALQEEQPEKHKAKLLAGLRKAAGKYPDDPWAKRALAIGEAASGDKDTAARLLDSLLETQPDDPELLRWRASLYDAASGAATAQDVSAARKLLVRAFKQAPNDWRVLRDFADTYQPREKALSPQILEILIRARQLAPQEPQLGLTLGIALARSGRPELAAAAIAPILNDPHASSDLALERGLFDALKSGDAQRVDSALLGLKLGRPPALPAAE